jgi:hypothetical protein
MTEIQCNLATTTFELTVDSCISFLTPHIGELNAIDKVDAVLSDFESAVTTHPLLYPVSQELLSLGVPDVRVCARGGFKLFYTFEGNEVTGLFLLRDKQSVEKQLIEHCLLR